MPKDNMEKAIKKGSGEMEGVSYEDFTFEGYGRAGVAVILEGSTDNRNRTTSEIRHLFGKYGGNLGENGCVSWMFHKKGIILVNAEGQNEDGVMEIALEAGAEDFKAEEGMFQITTAMEEMLTVREALEAKGLKIESSNLELIPDNTIEVAGKDAEHNLKLINALEEHDDVSRVASNADFDPALLAQSS
jgi:YebC/PmpR family DNA-binding regulatory protein